MPRKSAPPFPTFRPNPRLHSDPSSHCSNRLCNDYLHRKPATRYDSESIRPASPTLGPAAAILEGPNAQPADQVKMEALRNCSLEQANSMSPLQTPSPMSPAFVGEARTQTYRPYRPAPPSKSNNTAHSSATASANADNNSDTGNNRNLDGSPPSAVVHLEFIRPEPGIQHIRCPHCAAEPSIQHDQPDACVIEHNCTRDKWAALDSNWESLSQWVGPNHVDVEDNDDYDDESGYEGDDEEEEEMEFETAGDSYVGPSEVVLPPTPHWDSWAFDRAWRSPHQPDYFENAHGVAPSLPKEGVSPKTVLFALPTEPPTPRLRHHTPPPLPPIPTARTDFGHRLYNASTSNADSPAPWLLQKPFYHDPGRQPSGASHTHHYAQTQQQPSDPRLPGVDAVLAGQTLYPHHPPISEPLHFRTFANNDGTSDTHTTGDASGSGLTGVENVSSWLRRSERLQQLSPSEAVSPPISTCSVESLGEWLGEERLQWRRGLSDAGYLASGEERSGDSMSPISDAGSRGAATGVATDGVRAVLSTEVEGSEGRAEVESASRLNRFQRRIKLRERRRRRREGAPSPEERRQAGVGSGSGIGSRKSRRTFEVAMRSPVPALPGVVGLKTSYDASDDEDAVMLDAGSAEAAQEGSRGGEGRMAAGSATGLGIRWTRGTKRGLRELDLSNVWDYRRTKLDGVYDGDDQSEVD